MNHTFRLTRGHIHFSDGKIYISDNAKAQKQMILFSTGIYCVWGIHNIHKFDQLEDQFFYIFWIILTLISIFIFIRTLFNSTKNQFLISEVKSFHIKTRFKNTSMNIKLTNNQTRRIQSIEEADKLKEYLEANFADLLK